MATHGNSKLVAIVDDDDLMRSALQGLLKSVGLPARAFSSAEEFLTSGQQHQTACLIADIRMPGMSGLELQGHVNAEHCRIPTTIFITAHGDAKMRMQALRAGAVEFMAKPFDDEVLLADRTGSGGHYFSRCNYSEGLRAHFDPEDAGSSRLGDRRPERRSHQTWLETHYSDPQDAEAWHFPALSPKRPGCDRASRAGTERATAIMVGIRVLHDAHEFSNPPGDFAHDVRRGDRYFLS
jgi:CheY-like chemotaxis protein